jgi:hypothetical protein
MTSLAAASAVVQMKSPPRRFDVQLDPYEGAVQREYGENCKNVTPSHSLMRRNTKEALVPPKPKELDSATFTSRFLE